MNDLKIIFIGSGKRGASCLRELIKNNKQIVLCINNYKTKAKKATEWDTSVSKISADNSIDIFSPKNINDSSFIQKIRILAPSLIVVSNYSQILKKEILSVPKFGVLNCHGAYLPSYRGSSPINWAIINGEKFSGCSVIRMDEGIDTGPILYQEKYRIDSDDTVLTVHEKTFEIFPRILLKSIEKIEKGDYEGEAQDESIATYYHRRSPEDGEIKWDVQSANDVHNLVRGLTHPYPGAFTFFNGKKLYIWSSKLISENIRGTPGRICFIRDEGVVVVAKDRSLLIMDVQLEGGNIQLSNQVFKKQGEKLGISSKGD